MMSNIKICFLGCSGYVPIDEITFVGKVYFIPNDRYNHGDKYSFGLSYDNLLGCGAPNYSDEWSATVARAQLLSAMEMDGVECNEG